MSTRVKRPVRAGGPYHSLRSRHENGTHLLVAESRAPIVEQLTNITELAEGDDEAERGGVCGYHPIKRRDAGMRSEGE